MKHKQYRLKMLARIRACWHILTNKDFYCVITTDYYSNKEPLATLTLSNLPQTETAIKKVQKALNYELSLLKMIKQ